MSGTVCQLCRMQFAIENSHVISKLVFRAIKSDSPTGFFRNPNDPNRRFQDGDKFPLLCEDCEQRFGNAENEFAANVFYPFHYDDTDKFTYGPWLHYFMTSIAWRTLILDLPGLQADSANPPQVISDVSAAAETMRLYLLGANNLGDSIRNHAIVQTCCTEASPELAAAGPNVSIRRSVIGYTIIDRQHGYSGILHNLAGFMCFLIVKENPRDIWSGTKVDPAGGGIKQPQRVTSWLVHELLGCVCDFAQKNQTMSETQQRKVLDLIRKNPSAPSGSVRQGAHI